MKGGREFILSNGWKHLERILQSMKDANNIALNQTSPTQEPDTICRLQGANLLIETIMSTEFKTKHFNPQREDPED